MKYKYITVVNGGKQKYECFDAFSKVFNSLTLCDGANSCESSGKLAKDLANVISEKLFSINKVNSCRKEAISKIISEVHEEYVMRYGVGASTLISLNILNEFYEIFEVC